MFVSSLMAMESSAEIGVEFDTDSDKIKLFVGQIPKEYDEVAIKRLLEEFGPIHEVRIIKDKDKKSKGCAFVTYCLNESAVNAQKNLHEKRTLPEMNHPMQVKPATQTSKDRAEDRRLFVGQIAPDMNEEQVANMFAPFGIVEDVSILRGKDGISKKAAFVRMSSRAEALKAIEALHQSQTLPGVAHRLNVKVADTERDKELKKLQQTLNAVTQQPIMSNIRFSGLTPPNIGMDGYSYLREPIAVPSLSIPSLQLAQLQQAAAAAGTTVGNSFGLGTGAMTSMLINNNSNNNLSANFLPDMPLGGHIGNQAGGGSNLSFGSAHQGLGNLGSAVLSATINNPSNKLANDQIMQSYQVPNMQQYPAALPAQSQFGRYVHQKQREGPEGANLFIYHLPNDIKDHDLGQLFSQFGNVISAKVFLDKHTNLSKCFGFVSFDTSQAGQAAIQAMNGYQIGTKRLKVQLKRPKDVNKSYW